MEDLATWIAPVATTIAAMMTAANGGARLTGWGFVIFAIGAVAWLGYGLASSQPNLVWQNAILLAIDLIGIWRWLGRQARYESGAEVAERRSRKLPQETLFSGGTLAGLAATDDAGKTGELVDAMIGCSSGRIAYAVARKGGVGGLGERLVAVPWNCIRHEGDRVRIPSFDQAQELDPDGWPGKAA